MLVLARRSGQEITIAGGTVRVTVLGVSGGRVRLGIQAPQDMPVVRSELLPNDALLAGKDPSVSASGQVLVLS
ncbi:carbon storage regulator [bacterium]|nr:carbon storage regulator [bacterium]